MPEDAGEDPLGRLMRRERVTEVRATLANLKADRAQLLLLRHSGLSYQEIAAAMQIKAGSVGTMLARAEAEFSGEYEKLQRAKRRDSQTASHGGSKDLPLRAPAKEGR